MMSNSTMHQFADYMIRTANFANSTGLYNGKAGIALSLFEISRHLNSNLIENQAFNLLQEVLSNQNKDVSFENGLSGIGYVLNYLIVNQYIEACFDEVFGEHLNIIVGKIDEMKEQYSREEMLRNIKIVYFLNDYNLFDPSKKLTKHIDFFLIKSTQSLEEMFSLAENHFEKYSKMNLLNYFKTYLKIVDECEHATLSSTILKQYSELYKRDKLASSYMIGYHLGNIASTLKDNYLKEIADQNKKTALKNIYVDTMTISQQINLLNMLLPDEKNERTSLVIALLEKELMHEEELGLFSRQILHKIPQAYLPFGYQYGIARLLHYWVHRASGNINNRIFL